MTSTNKSTWFRGRHLADPARRVDHPLGLHPSQDLGSPLTHNFVSRRLPDILNQVILIIYLTFLFSRPAEAIALSRYNVKR